MKPNESRLLLPGRRDVLRGLGVTTAVIGTAGPFALSGGRALAATPQRGGRLRIGWYSSSANDTLNPVRLTSAYDWMRAHLIMNPLVRYDAQMNLEPDLAVSWESDDAKVWTFRLREGVEFHNGKSLSAEDVVYSLDLHRGDDSESAIKAWFSAVEDISAVDPMTVRITLSSPDADLPRLLGWPSTMIVPAGFTDFANAVGTGPFRLQEFEPGVTLRGTRYENYHFDGKPYVDEIQTIGISDSSARMNALLSGDVDYIAGVDPKVVHLIERANGAEVAAATGSQHFTFPMRSEHDPYSNVHLRQALRHLTDRQAMLDNVLKGYGALGNDHPFSPADPYFCNEIPQRAFDPEKAKWHLEQAGLDGAKLTLHTSEAAGGAMAPDLALLLKESAAAGGVEIEVKREPTDSYWSGVWNKQPFAMSNWLPRPTANMMLSQVYLSDAKWNEANFQNERFDTLVRGVRSVTDEALRREMYCEVQQILYDEGGSIIPLFMNWIDARSDKLNGWEGHPFGPADGYRLGEQAWFTA
ncbi:peptide/nickel transport system substrate-binding protein [Roseovarius azorensis]|uniref:Peptide/nickel transport system substrate-binding protein n=1 Tax=Roseovarius azorensis TaxID=1287727 RepID=A0A1H7Y0F1_9RHOB|nr:ABC transporter substrate-binding protein [Roseovarius azorensis]SEM39676.1 peptide/nickel transport system substrate-binding protein [Roseovarius azorensis]